MIEPDMANIAELRNWILTGVAYTSERREAVLSLEYWDGRKRSVTLAGVVQLNISGMPHESGPSDVIGARAERLDDGGKVALEMLGHSFRHGDTGAAEYPGVELIRLELVGDVCVNALCQRISETDTQGPGSHG